MAHEAWPGKPRKGAYHCTVFTSRMPEARGDSSLLHTRAQSVLRQVMARTVSILMAPKLKPTRRCLVGKEA